MQKILIIGAGPAGLTAAHELLAKSADCAVTVFEESSVFGGISRTVGRNGQHRYNTIDHSMMTSFEAVAAILDGSTDKSRVWNVNTEEEYHEGK